MANGYQAYKIIDQEDNIVWECDNIEQAEKVRKVLLGPPTAYPQNELTIRYEGRKKLSSSYILKLWSGPTIYECKTYDEAFKKKYELLAGCHDYDGDTIDIIRVDG